jgi:tetratricopeptide (TPR) repeat protein
LWMRVQELATRSGDFETALAAARSVLALVPLDDNQTPIAVSAAMVELHRNLGDVPAAISQLERVLRDQPHHVPSLEALVELHLEQKNYQAAARYQFQLVPLSGTHIAKAARLYSLGALLADHLGDIDRADDVLLRAIDLNPSHIATLQRLLDTFWRSGDYREFTEVAIELRNQRALIGPDSMVSDSALGRVVALLRGAAEHSDVADHVLHHRADELQTATMQAQAEMLAAKSS